MCIRDREMATTSQPLLDMKNPTSLRLGLDRDTTVQYLYEEYDSILYNYTVGLCKRYNIPIVQAEDLMQEFYLSVLKNHSGIIKGYLTRGMKFLFRVIKNDLFDYHRKKKSQQRLEEIYSMGVRLDFNLYYLAPDLFHANFTNQIKRLLPSTDYVVFKLYLQGYTYQEIQNQLQLNINTIGVKIFRAKKILRSFYQA